MRFNAQSVPSNASRGGGGSTAGDIVYRGGECKKAMHLHYHDYYCLFSPQCNNNNRALMMRTIIVGPRPVLCSSHSAPLWSVGRLVLFCSVWTDMAIMMTYHMGWRLQMIATEEEGEEEDEICVNCRDAIIWCWMVLLLFFSGGGGGVIHHTQPPMEKNGCFCLLCWWCRCRTNKSSGTTNDCLFYPLYFKTYYVHVRRMV